MTPGTDLDLTALSSWLERSLPGFRGPLKAEKFNRGSPTPRSGSAQRLVTMSFAANHPVCC